MLLLLIVVATMLFILSNATETTTTILNVVQLPCGNIYGAVALCISQALVLKYTHTMKYYKDFIIFSKLKLQNWCQCSSL